MVETEKRIVTYDIQCYNIKDKITVLGHTFNGLDEVVDHNGIIGKEFHYGFECFPQKEAYEYTDIYIGEIKRITSYLIAIM